MTRRTTIEIYYDILTAIAKGKKRVTHIMYASNTSINPLHKCLNTLLECEIITYKKPFYDITQKGFDYINTLDALRELVD